MLILGDEDLQQPKLPARGKESKGNVLIGNKRKYRKITFMFPSHEGSKPKATLAKDLSEIATASKRRDSIEESEFKTDVTCDVIEHI